jgi:regulatory protein
MTAPGSDKSAPGSSAAHESAARAIALRLLESQPRTRAELARAMARRGVPDDAAAVVLDRFEEVGLVDDEAFAASWVTSRHAGRGLGRRALGQELRRRGVAADLVRDAVAVVTGDDEEAAARALATRRLRTMTGLPRETQLRRLVGMLARKGFSHSLAMKVAVDTVDSGDATAPVEPIDFG